MILDWQELVRYKEVSWSFSELHILVYPQKIWERQQPEYNIGIMKLLLNKSF